MQLNHKYTMQISRLTIDKLGIRMYDRVSAVLAELIANAYDADAETVTINLPFGEYLAKKVEGKIKDQGYEIVIEDDGSGMTAEEVNNYYLKVGYDRRSKRGELTSKHNRLVMGRKGIGKLAPFGICHEVEIISAGGDPTDNGYIVSNLVLDLEDMLEEKVDESGNIMPYNPKPGRYDGTYKESSGTKLILRHFDRRRVPRGEDLHRQLAARFGISRDDWSVWLEDSLRGNSSIELGTLKIDVMDGTRISVNNRPVKYENRELEVSGWVAYAKDPYKDEVMAGVRIYARGKIVAQTRDFDIKTGFTGEFKMRSYLTGEIHAEWLDKDEDFIRTDRQDIIWNSDLGVPLRDWGQELLRELAAKAETSTRRRIWDIFLEESQLKRQLKERFPDDNAMRVSILKAARLLVPNMDRGSVKNRKYIKRIIDFAYAVGPHRDLLKTLDDIASLEHGTTDVILSLFEKARLVEIYSLGQVAQERVEVIKRLRKLATNPSTVENALQQLIERAPWILHPDWTPLSYNKSLSTTRENFQSWYYGQYKKEIVTSAVDDSTKRPDFIMINYEGLLEVVEIKRPHHKLKDDEFNRAFDYFQAVRKFVEETTTSEGVQFSKARLTIVCDGLALGTRTLELKNRMQTDLDLIHKSWIGLLEATTTRHEDFLQKVRELQGRSPESTEIE